MADKRSRVTLVQAPEGVRFIPLALLNLATYIKQFGHDPIILDLSLYYEINRNINANFFRDAALKILKTKPQVIGFSVMCNTLPASLLIAKECKRIGPSIPIVFGGVEVSFDEIDLMKEFGQIDIIVRREGEITLAKVLEAIKGHKSLSNILGITFRGSKGITRNPDRPLIKDLDSLPLPDFPLLPFRDKYHVGQIETGRGCPYNCSYCTCCKLWERTFRVKSPKRLIKELRLASKYFKRSNASICFVHDNFFCSKRSAEEFISLAAKENIPWTCYSRLEPLLNSSLIARLKKSHCKSVYIGIETGSSNIQKEINKNLPLHKATGVIASLYKAGISVFISLIIGFPGETRDEMNKTLLLALQLKLLGPENSTVWIHPLTFLKGSDLFARIKKDRERMSFRETSYSPLITDLPAERVLVKKYPLVFPSFYYLKNNIIDFKTLNKIRTLYNMLIDCFPGTTNLLISFMRTTPIELTDKIIYFFDKWEVQWKPSFFYYFPYFRKFIKRIPDPRIKKSFMREFALKMNKDNRR